MSHRRAAQEDKMQSAAALARRVSEVELRRAQHDFMNKSVQVPQDIYIYI